ERTLQRVSDRLKKTVQHYGHWSRKFNWPERALAWDQEQDRVQYFACNKALARAVEKVTYEQELNSYKVLEEVSNIGFARLTEAAEWDGDKLVLRDSRSLPDHVAAAIQSIEVSHDRQGNPVHKIKFHSKAWALDKLGQHRKLWGPREDNSQTETNQT